MSVLMNVVSIWRSRSGLTWASCSCRKTVRSILLGAVIALVSWVSVEGHPEDHAMAASTSGPATHQGGRTPPWGTPCRHNVQARDSEEVVLKPLAMAGAISPVVTHRHSQDQ